MAKYLPRIVDNEIQSRLQSAGALVLEGPKASGKTVTARQAASSEVLLDVDPQARSAVEVDPRLVLEGRTPRLIDEWQIAPDLWNHVRRAVDERGLPGQFILTGSAVPRDDVTRHTGAGRMARLRMRPLSLFESGHSSGDIRLKELLEGGEPRSPDTELDVAEVTELLAVGGWPGHIRLPTPARLQVVRDYLDEINRVDIRRVDGTDFDPDRVARLIRSLARNVSTQVSTTTLARDAGGADGPLHRDTATRYLAALERLMIVEEQPAWAPHLRSRSVLRAAAKRLFVDPSLAVAAVRATPERLLQDLNYLGLLFESLVVRDLRVYAQPLDARVFHYRDNTGLEIDAIVETADGRWAAFEVKLGPRQVDGAAESLHRFASRIDKDRTGEPGMLGVIVASGYGFTRPDGVAVIPIGALGP